MREWWARVLGSLGKRPDDLGAGSTRTCRWRSKRTARKHGDVSGTGP
jgi:hypothetical protein